MSRHIKWISRNQLAYASAALSNIIVLMLTTQAHAETNAELYSSEYWAKFSAISAAGAIIPSLVSAGATVAYAILFYRLQRQLNFLTEKNTRDNRLIEISTQWNSLEFVQARNRAFVTIDTYQSARIKMYDKLVQNYRLDEWNNISLIACFIERLSRLLADNQIDFHKARAEFGEGIIFWAKYLIPVHDRDAADRSLVMALNDVIARFENEQYYHYNYLQKNSDQKIIS